MNLLEKVKNDAEAQELQADWCEEGPRCSQQMCAQFDGKRCQALGFKPGAFCEPAVKLMTLALATVKP